MLPWKIGENLADFMDAEICRPFQMYWRDRLKIPLLY
jgi:hypothetical protein